MKKLKTLSLILLALSLVACRGEGQEEKIKIGIVQLIQHEALDNSRRGFEDGLEQMGIEAEIDYKNAQGDMGTVKSIVESFKGDQVDLIYAIATPAAQGAQAVTDQIPIVFSAVTDPVEAGLVEKEDHPGGNITGLSDGVNIGDQLALFQSIDPKIKRIGVLYSGDEQNSYTQLKTIRDIGPSLGLEIVESPIQTISDLPMAAQSLTSKVDGLYILSDNKIASSISLLTQIAKEQKIPTVCVEEGHVRQGGLISQGISYYKLGQQGADMAKKILLDGIKPGDIGVERSKNFERVYNSRTLDSLGLDPSLEVFTKAKDIESKGE